MQSVARASRLAGMGLVSLAVPTLGPHLGRTSMLALLGFCTLFQSMAALLIKEIPISPQVLRAELISLGRMLRLLFGNRLVWYSLLSLISVYAAVAGALIVGRLPRQSLTSLKFFIGFSVAYWMV